MRRVNLLRNIYSVSEVVGSVLLLLIAIVAFAAIYTYLYPPPPDQNIPVKINGMVDDSGSIVLEHVGGPTIESCEVFVRYIDGNLIGSKKINNWKIGEKIYPCEGLTSIKLVDENTGLWVSVYAPNDYGNSKEIFNGILYGKVKTSPGLPSEGPMLISSLRTNSIDEDLICFTHRINSSLNVSSFIYNWLVNGKSFATVVMPFDTINQTSTKDYSGNGYNGTINGATWVNNGVIGGAYFFDGSNSYIEFDRPDVFNDISENDFTVCMWIKSSCISDDWRVIFEAKEDTMNFAKIFQFGNQTHFGVCDEGTKRCVRTEELASNTWYHIACVWKAKDDYLAIYVNGVKSTEVGNRNYAHGAHEKVTLGQGTASSRFWYGYIDELRIYDHALSDEQIYQLYFEQKDGLTNKSIMVAEETKLGQTWQCIVTPTDGSIDDTSVVSNTLQIVNYPGGD